MKNKFKKPLLFVSLLILINIFSNYFYKRFDLTQDNRFTLSDVSEKILKKIAEPIYVDVYLDGELPADFKRLQNETKQVLEEFEAINNNVIYRFINTSENKETSFTLKKELFKKGLSPENVTVTENGKQSELMIFPYAIVNYKGKETNIRLLKNIMGASIEDKILGSAQNLEYAFADGFNKVLTEKQKKIAIIKGNGETAEPLIAKFLLQTRESYHIGPFTLDSVATNPNKSLKALEQYDLAIIIKPTKKFSDSEKQVLDQFIVNGGKAIFLIDQVTMDLESLYNPSGQGLAFPKDLNLNDMFFKYGIRISSDLIKDELGTPIKLASGEAGSQTKFQEFNWKYAPFIVPESSHPIVKNLGGLKFDFTNPIEILKNSIQKTVLLHSSLQSKIVGTPTIISLNSVNEEEDFEQYKNSGNYPVAVLLEGQFHSVFENRILAFKDVDFKPVFKKSKIIVISDGNVVQNTIDKNGFPVELGYDATTGNLFDNKDLIQNAVNYVLDDTGLINLRSKDFSLPLLDKQKVFKQYKTTQAIAIFLPLVILLVFAVAFNYLRKRKYAK